MRGQITKFENVKECKENLELKHLVTPYQNKKLPVYDWYNYKHSFSRDLVIKLIEGFQLQKCDKILDPFCGSGTTLLACKEMGIPVYGIDILPLSVFISNAKLKTYDKNHIEDSIKEFKDILKDKRKRKKVKGRQKNLLKKFFREDILNNILFIKEWIEDKNDEQIKYFFLTALLSILESVSYTRKDGGFLRIVKNKNFSDVKSVYLSKLQKMFTDLELLYALPNSEAKAFEGDARKTIFKTEEFSAVITSPPYPNRHDYTRVYFLELMVGFMESYDELKNLRYFSIRSHVEARKRFTDESYVAPEILRRLSKKLEDTHLPNRAVITMLEGYFEDMYMVFKEIHRLLKPSGKVAFVVGDVRYGGIKIPVSDALINLGYSVGLEFKEKITARIRGNSPQQMKKYGKEPMEENILIWIKR